MKSLSRTIQAQRVPGSWSPQISRQSAHVGGKLSPPPLSRKNSWYLFLLEADSIPVPWFGLKENSNDNVGNRNCDLPPSSAVPQSTAPRHNPFVCRNYSNFRMDTCKYKTNLTVATIPDFVVVWVKTLCATQKRFGCTCCLYFRTPKNDSYNKRQRDAQVLKFIW
jgi:hypothetical protein